MKQEKKKGKEDCMTKIATQTFGLKQKLTADLTGTIEKLHTVGFDAIEPIHFV